MSRSRLLDWFSPRVRAHRAPTRPQRLICPEQRGPPGPISICQSSGTSSSTSMSMTGLRSLRYRPASGRCCCRPRSSRRVRQVEGAPHPGSGDGRRREDRGGMDVGSPCGSETGTAVKPRLRRDNAHSPPRRRSLAGGGLESGPSRRSRHLRTARAVIPPPRSLDPGRERTSDQPHGTGTSSATCPDPWLPRAVVAVGAFDRSTRRR